MKNKSLLLIVFVLVLFGCSQNKDVNLNKAVNQYLDCADHDVDFVSRSTNFTFWSLGYVFFSPKGNSFSQNKNGIRVNRESFDFSTKESTMFALINNVKDVDSNDKQFLFAFEVIDSYAKVIILDYKSLSEIEENKDEVIEKLSQVTSSCKVLTKDEFSSLTNDPYHKMEWTNEYNGINAIYFVYDNSYSQIFITLLENKNYFVSIFGYDLVTNQDINIGYDDKYVRKFGNFYKLLNFRLGTEEEENDYYLEIKENSAILYMYDLRLQMLMPLLELPK